MQIPTDPHFEILPSFGLKAWVTGQDYIALANAPTIGNEDEGIVLLTPDEARRLMGELQKLIDLAESKEEQE